MSDGPAAPSEVHEVAVLVLAAHWVESAWNDRVPQEAWDWAFAEGHVSQVADPTGEQIPYLTDKGQERLRELLADG